MWKVVDSKSKKVKAILVIDDIPEELFNEHLSIRYTLLHYPDGQMEEVGIGGKKDI